MPSEVTADGTFTLLAVAGKTELVSSRSATMWSSSRKSVIRHSAWGVGFTPRTTSTL